MPTKKVSSRSAKKKTRKSARTHTRRVVKRSSRHGTALSLSKSKKNPIITPRAQHAWESQATFNPAAILENGKVHILYRAIGDDGLSVIGYASTKDGITIKERLDAPAYTLKLSSPRTKAETYDAQEYISGGGWGGAEDPRLTRMGDTVYMTFVAFDGWNPPRVAITSISLENFLQKRWKWAGAKLISPPGIVDKSACLFPEKINGKYTILHRIFPNILLDFVDDLNFKKGGYLQGQYKIKPRANYWDSRKIGAGAPPIKTDEGWLLIYYAVDDHDPSKYKIGAMLLDLKEPQRVIVRSDEPILEPIAWYENEGHKAGIAYPCGAVVKNGTLYVYYGGADSVVCVATANVKDFLSALLAMKKPKLRTRL